MQWPYEAAAIAFEAIPRTLAQNCGVNVIRTMTALQGKVKTLLFEVDMLSFLYLCSSNSFHIPIACKWRECMDRHRRKHW